MTQLAEVGNPDKQPCGGGDADQKDHAAHQRRGGHGYARPAPANPAASAQQPSARDEHREGNDNREDNQTHEKGEYNSSKMKRSRESRSRSTSGTSTRWPT